MFYFLCYLYTFKNNGTPLGNREDCRLLFIVSCHFKSSEKLSSLKGKTTTTTVFCLLNTVTECKLNVNWPCRLFNWLISSNCYHHLQRWKNKEQGVGGYISSFSFAVTKLPNKRKGERTCLGSWCDSSWQRSWWQGLEEAGHIASTHSGSLVRKQQCWTGFLLCTQGQSSGDDNSHFPLALSTSVNPIKSVLLRHTRRHVSWVSDSDLVKSILAINH